MTKSSVIFPAEDVGSAVQFLEEALGIELRFRDGERYAALSFGGSELALLGQDERRGVEPALGFQVEDLNATLADWTEKGAEILGGIDDGPHERRATVLGPGGLRLIASQKHAG